MKHLCVWSCNLRPHLFPSNICCVLRCACDLGLAHERLPTTVISSHSACLLFFFWVRLCHCGSKSMFQLDCLPLKMKIKPCSSCAGPGQIRLELAEVSSQGASFERNQLSRRPQPKRLLCKKTAVHFLKKKMGLSLCSHTHHLTRR